MHIVIVGGGINGLLSAYELAKAGHVISLYEAEALGRQSSWAGGGIVSPLYPWRYSPAVTALSEWAKSSYPALCQQLFEATGIDPELERCGMLYLDPSDLRDAIAWAQAHQCAYQVVVGAELQQRWPQLNDDVQLGLWLPDIAHVRNPRLLQALIRYLNALPNVSLHAHVVVDDIYSATAEQSASVQLADGQRVAADHVVVCAGAWSAQLLPTAAVQVAPVRGQMVQYACEPGEFPCMMMRDGHYIIPRRDGLVLCGSTLEHVGFQNVVTDAAREQLDRTAANISRIFKKKTLVAHWSGLRPGSPNGIPFIGPVPGQDGLWVNAGQYRNGLVLAPASARLLKQLLLGEATITAPEPYRLLC